MPGGWPRYRSTRGSYDANEAEPLGWMETGCDYLLPGGDAADGLPGRNGRPNASQPLLPVRRRSVLRAGLRIQAGPRGGRYERAKRSRPESGPGSARSVAGFATISRCPYSILTRPATRFIAAFER